MANGVPKISRSIMLPPEEGKSVWMGGIGVIFKLYGKDTGGSFSIVEHPIEPGTLVPPHMHTKEDEFSYVLEGKIGAKVGNQVVEATPGAWVFKPRNIPHTFWNAGPKLARLIEIISPAGFEEFFEEAPQLFPADSPPNPEQLTKLAARFGVSLQWWDWVPELTAKYKLKVAGR